MPTVLITGASRGLGLEFARQYARDGWTVIATCRNPARTPRLDGLGVEVRRLDVSDFAAIDLLAAELKGRPIDLLVNNAGQMGPSASLHGIDFGAWAEVMRVNAMAPLKMTQAFLDHVAASEGKRIVALTSRMGSIADNASGGSYIYRSSKAALNAAMKSLSVDLRPQGIAVAVFHPGWVRTDMGGRSGLLTPEDSVRSLRKLFDGLDLSKSGRFFNVDGQELPW